MNFLLDVLIFFKRKNFTIVREFDMGDKSVKEYSYGSNTYFTDTWPPSRGTGFPIKSVTFENDDVTKQMLKFSGPMKNHVNILGLYKKRMRFVTRFVDGGVSVRLQEFWEPREGTVTITDVLGGVKKETLFIIKNGDTHLPS